MSHITGMRRNGQLGRIHGSADDKCEAFSLLNACLGGHHHSPKDSGKSFLLFSLFIVLLHIKKTKTSRTPELYTSPQLSPALSPP